MATYLPNVTDYIPQLQPFRPDFNFYAKALQMKQGKYDANHKRLSNLYESLLNAPMLRDKNIQQRDQFFKMIDQDIKKMASVDLSLQQNVDAASDVFNQLLDNDNIVKDMVWTRNWQNEQKRGESFRNCVDPKECGGAWWEGGVQALNYRAQEFKNASDEEALNMANARFTPYQDVTKMAIDLAKDAGLNIEIDQIQGRYITTTKNGPMLVKPLQNLFMGSIAKDPKVMEYYKTKAYVDRKGWVAENTSVYGSEEAAEAAYYNNMTNEMSEFFGQTKESVNADSENVTAHKRQLEERIQREGTTQGSSLANEYRRITQQEEDVNASKEVVDKASGSNDVAKRNGYGKGAMQMTDNTLAAYYMGVDISRAANTLAYKDYKFSLKADPYALENVKQANRMALAEYNLRGAFAKEKFKFDLEQYAKKIEAVGDDIDNIPAFQQMKDAYEKNLDPRAGYEAFEKTREEIQGRISAPERKITTEVVGLMQNQAKQEKGNGVATSDLVEMVDAFAAKGALEGTEREELKNWDSKTFEEKAAYATSSKFMVDLQNEGLDGSILDHVYDNHVATKIDMTKESNAVSRRYLKPLWEKTAGLRDEIRMKEQILTNLDQWHADQTKTVLSEYGKQFTGGTGSEEYKTMVDFIDQSNGLPKTKKAFAEAYANRKRNEAPDAEVVETFTPSSQMPMGDPMDRKMDRRIEGVGYSTQTRTVDKDAVYRNAYRQAEQMYDEQAVSEVGSPGLGGWARIAWNAATGDYTEAAQLRARYVTEGIEHTGLWNNWASAWGRYAEPAGGMENIGLSGFGSEAGMGLNYPMMDPAKYMSGATTQTTSFLKNALSAGEDNMTVVLGSGGNHYGQSSEEAKTIMRQLSHDIMNRRSAKDGKRPILDVTYQDAVHGTGDWTALNLKLNNTYIQQYVGSEKNPGMLREHQELLQNQGMTIYLKKDAANNLFRQSVSKTPTEKAFFFTGEHQFDSYPEVTENMRLYKEADGSLAIAGNYALGLDDQGQKIMQPLYQNFPDPRTDLNQMIQSFDAMLREYSLDLEMQQQQYNKANGIKDPSQLL